MTFPKKLSQEEKELLAWIARPETERPETELRLSAGLEQLATEAGVLHVLARDPRIRKQMGPMLDQYLATAALGAFKLRALQEISGAMEREGIQIMPIKGMAYALMFGSGGPDRPMADVDILVRERDYQRALELMHGLGYEDLFASRVSRSKEHNERAMTKNGQMVEIHRAFVVKGRISVDYQKLFARSREISKEDIHCRLLGAEDAFLYHCFHMGLHEFAVGGLRSVLELVELLEKDPPDFELARRRAEKWGSKRMTWCALRIARLCVPEKIDPKIVSLFEPGPAIRTALEHAVVRPSLSLALHPAKLPRPVQLFRKALLLDRSYLALGYTARYIVKSLGR